MSDMQFLFLVYGMSLMFYAMMSWIFMRKPRTRLKMLIGTLMLIITAQYIKDIYFLGDTRIDQGVTNDVAACLDFVSVPFFCLIVFELCRPGCVTMRGGTLCVAPFALLTVVFLFTESAVAFLITVVLSLALGVFCAVWAFHEIPIFHRRLKEEFSYDEDINLYWLRGVAVSFLTMLFIWVLSCYLTVTLTQIIYMLGSLVCWTMTCFFIHRQQEVLNAVRSNVVPSAISVACDETASEEEAKPDEQPDDLGRRLRVLFAEERIYLDPKLRLTDLAQRIGTNRTYLSQYFNQVCQQSFYEYVNNFRLAYAGRLLRNTDYTLDVVAAMSGFNSLSTFRRAFLTAHGCTAQEYRIENQTDTHLN